MDQSRSSLTSRQPLWYPCDGSSAWQHTALCLTSPCGLEAQSCEVCWPRPHAPGSAPHRASHRAPHRAPPPATDGPDAAPVRLLAVITRAGSWRSRLLLESSSQADYIYIYTYHTFSFVVSLAVNLLRSSSFSKDPVSVVWGIFLDRGRVGFWQFCYITQARIRPPTSPRCMFHPIGCAACRPMASDWTETRASLAQTYWQTDMERGGTGLLWLYRGTKGHFIQTHITNTPD